MKQEVNLAEIPVRELIQAAAQARKKAYAPYSGYQVGAALLTNELRIYTGCNIENAAYSPGICAERCAIAKAVSEGFKKWRAIAIVGGRGEDNMDYSFPCGVCRQTIREFADPEKFVILVARDSEDYKAFLLKELLPESFGPENLEERV